MVDLHFSRGYISFFMLVAAVVVVPSSRFASSSSVPVLSVDGKVTMDCYTGADLAAAMGNKTVLVARIMTDMTLFDADWTPYQTPLPLGRNFSLVGRYEEEERWVTLDLGFVSKKVYIAPGDVMYFTQVVIKNWRRAPYFQALGWDFLVGNGIIDTYAVLSMYRGALIQNTCFSEKTGNLSLALIRLPPFVTSRQQQGPRVDRTSNCSNSTSAPAMQRCYATGGVYISLASNAFTVDVYGKTNPAGYVIWGEQTPYVCETVMSDECIARLGSPLGCYNSMFPTTNASTLVSPPPGPSSPPPAPAPALAAADLAGGLPSSGHRGSRSLLAGLLAGLLGGGVLVAAVSAALVLLAARARKRRGRDCESRADRGLQANGAPDGKGVSQAPAAGDLQAAMGTTAPSKPGGRQLAVLDTADELVIACEQTSEAALEDRPACLGSQEQTASDKVIPEANVQSPPLWRSTADLELVPVSPFSPVASDINLRVKLGGTDSEVELTSQMLGKGGFGRVVVGRYGGQAVAVKLLDRGWGVKGDAGAPPQQPTSAAAFEQSGVAYASSAESKAGQVVVELGSEGNGGNQVAEAAEAGAAVGSDGAESGQGDGAPSGGNRATGAPAGGSGADPSRPPVADSETTTWSLTREAVESIKREVEVLARCHHPNVIRLLAASLEPSRVCLVMELMDTSLARLMYSGGAGRALLPMPKVLNIAMQVARALSYLHPTILHRDLKPANVLISNADSDQPIVKLADFGFSRLLDTVLITLHPEVGTAPYMAPEVFDVQNSIITDRSDVYALGVILWEMLSGEQPWKGHNLVQIAFQVALHGQRLPLSSIPPERRLHKLESLLTACWDPVPARRPAAAEVLKALALAMEALESDASGSGVATGANAVASGGGAAANAPSHGRLLDAVACSAKSAGDTAGPDSTWN